MGKKDFSSYICSLFCKFYHKGEKLHMACRGAQIIESLVQNDLLKIEKIPRNGKNPDLWEDRDSYLEKILCQHCEFHEKDCSFQSKNYIAGAEPCGGYILLCLLKKKGIISEEDLIQIKYEE